MAPASRWNWVRPGRWSLVVAVLSTIFRGLSLAFILIDLFSHLAYDTWKPWNMGKERRCH
jgi:hypothetical protein